MPKSDDHDLTEETPSTAEEPSRYMAYLARIRNLFRVSKSIRYIGYSSDIGEAFRPMVPPALVNASYAIAVGYIGADVAIHMLDEHEKTEGQKWHDEAVLREGIQTMTFQGLASLLIPAVVIHKWVSLLSEAQPCSWLKPDPPPPPPPPQPHPALLLLLLYTGWCMRRPRYAYVAAGFRNGGRRLRVCSAVSAICKLLTSPSLWCLLSCLLFSDSV